MFLLLSTLLSLARVAHGVGSDVSYLGSPVFVRALDYDVSTNFRESAAVACSRVGLISAAGEAALGTAAAPLAWDADTLASAVASLGSDYAVADDAVAGCCAAGLWCRRRSNGSGASADGGYSCFTHAPLNASGTFVNYGWTLDSSAVPVYACVASSSPLATRAALAPFIGSARVIPATPSVRTRMQLDGLRFGVNASAIDVQVGDAPCTNPYVCSRLCARCTSSADCGADKFCVSVTSNTAVGVCVALCDATSSCACGATCYNVSSTYGTPFKLCANAGVTSIPLLCSTGATPFSPALNTGYSDRVECTPPGQPTRVPTLPRGASGSSGRALGLAGGVEIRAPSLIGTIYELDGGRPQLLNAVGEQSRWQRETIRLRGAGVGGGLDSGMDGRRHLLTSMRTSIATGVENGRNRYGGACAGTNGSVVAGGIFPVILIAAGRASTGLNASFAAAGGVMGSTSASASAAAAAAAGTPSGATAPAADAAAEAFRNLGYTGYMPLYANSTFECSVDSDCAMIDACSTPVCLNASGTADTVASGSKIGGCCVYVPRSSATANGTCATSSSLQVTGDPPGLPFMSALPAAAAAALPFIPPPRADASITTYCPAADPSKRVPASNPFGYVWDARSPWYDLKGSAVLNTTVQGPTAYYLSDASTASVSVTLDGVRLPFSVGHLGSQRSTASIASTGYIMLSSSAVTLSTVNPCGGDFANATCGFSTDYNNIVAPLAANFKPGQYADSEVWWGAWDVGELAASATSGALPSSGEPASQLFCTAFIAMGLALPGSTFVDTPPNPGYNFFVCMHGDGSVRVRYGRILGSASDTKGAYVTASTLLPPVNPVTNATLGGPPASWLAALRTSTATRVAGEASRLLIASTSNTTAFPVISRDEVLFGAAAVRPGASLALCFVEAIACASPAGGGAGTSVSIMWGGASCGLGLEALSARGGVALTSAGRVTGARLLCLFGGVSAAAPTWSNYSAAMGRGTLTCVAPSQPTPAYAGTVPLTLVAVFPTSPRAYEKGGVKVTAGAAGLLGSGVGAGPPRAPLADNVVDNSAEAGVRLGVGGVDAIVWGANVTSFVGRALTFTYTAQSVPFTTGGCSGSDAAALCTPSGVCAPPGAAAPPVDCVGVMFGVAVKDSCGVCSGGTSGHAAGADIDCLGVCFGPARECIPASSTPSKDAPETDTFASISVLVVVVGLSVCMAVLLWVCVRRHLCQNDLSGDEAIEFLAMGNPEQLGLPAGLPTSALDRQELWTWGGAADPRARDMPSGAESCSVCMDDLNAGETLRVLTPCKHVFHRACVDEWFKRSTVCPVCRAELRTPEEIEDDRRIRRERAAMITMGVGAGGRRGRGRGGIPPLVALQPVPQLPVAPGPGLGPGPPPNAGGGAPPLTSHSPRRPTGPRPLSSQSPRAAGGSSVEIELTHFSSDAQPPPPLPAPHSQLLMYSNARQSMRIEVLPAAASSMSPVPSPVTRVDGEAQNLVGQSGGDAWATWRPEGSARVSTDFPAGSEGADIADPSFVRSDFDRSSTPPSAEFRPSSARRG